MMGTLFPVSTILPKLRFGLIARTVSQNAPLTIYHTNDSEGNEVNCARMITQIRRLRESAPGDTMTFHAGDVSIGGSKSQKRSYGLWRYANLDASTVGNHCLDPKDALDFLQKQNDAFYKRMERPKASKKWKLPKPFNILVANLKNFPWYRVVEKNGERFGLVGVTFPSDQQVGKFKHSEMSQQIDGFEATKKELKKVVNTLTQEEQINKIILISHSSIQNDLKIAQEVPGIDIIVGGDTHINLPDGVWEYNEKTGDPVLITQTLGEGSFFGEIKPTFDAAGRLIRENTQAKIYRTPLDGPIDMDLQAYLNKIKPKDEKPLFQIEGVQHINSIDKVRPNWLNLMLADAMLHLYDYLPPDKLKKLPKQPNKSLYPIDFALLRSSHFRASLPAGVPIYPNMIEAVSPFSDSVVLVEVTGLQIYALLQTSHMRWQLDDPRTYFPAGLTYTMDVNNPHLQPEDIIDVRTHQPIDLNQKYIVATTAYNTDQDTENPFYTKTGKVNRLFDTGFVQFSLNDLLQAKFMAHTQWQDKRSENDLPVFVPPDQLKTPAQAKRHLNILERPLREVNSRGESFRKSHNGAEELYVKDVKDD